MRTWLYNTLISDPGLSAYLTPLLKDQEALSNRFYQGETLSDRLVPKPYMFYTIGNATDEYLSELVLPYRQFFVVYIHDEPSDYSRIDDLVDLTKRALVNKQSKADGIITIRHLETSGDHDDNILGTILRYIRFQAIKER